MQDNLEEWQQRQIEMFWLPSYSPQLNLIEILWRFIKYEWIEIKAYRSWQTLVEGSMSPFSGEKQSPYDWDVPV